MNNSGLPTKDETVKTTWNSKDMTIPRFPIVHMAYLKKKETPLYFSLRGSWIQGNRQYKFRTFFTRTCIFTLHPLKIKIIGKFLNCNRPWTFSPPIYLDVYRIQTNRQTYTQTNQNIYNSWRASIAAAIAWTISSKVQCVHPPSWVVLSTLLTPLDRRSQGWGASFHAKIFLLSPPCSILPSLWP